MISTPSSTVTLPSLRECRHAKREPFSKVRIPLQQPRVVSILVRSRNTMSLSPNLSGDKTGGVKSTRGNAVPSSSRESLSFVPLGNPCASTTISMNRSLLKRLPATNGNLIIRRKGATRLTTVRFLCARLLRLTTIAPPIGLPEAKKSNEVNA